MRAYTMPVPRGEMLVREWGAYSDMVRELLAYRIATPHVPCFGENGDAWHGRVRFEQMRDALTGGYKLPDTYSAVVAALPPIGDDTDRRTVRSVAGSRPNVAASCAGSVRSMYATRTVDAPDVPIRIAAQFMAGHNIAPHAVSNANAGIVAAAISLKQAGGAVELYVFDTNTRAENDNNVMAGICAVNLDAVSPYEMASLAHGPTARALCGGRIHLRRQETEDYTSQAGRGLSLERAREVLAAWSPSVAALYVPGVWSRPAMSPPALRAAAHTSPVAVRDWVLAQVDELIALPTFS